MLTLRLLGPIEIRCNAAPLAAARRDKGLLLLAYLAASAGHSHAREDLADLFWPELAHERALHNLRQTLLRLRRLLADGADAPPCLRANAHTVAFLRDGDYWLDLEPFSASPADAGLEDLERRAALYRGPFLEDWAGGIGERFAAWVEERRAACQRNALALEQALASRHEQAGRIERAIVHARRFTQLEPWQEAGQRRLLRLLAQAGQGPAALHHFQLLRRELQQELGSEPEAETLALAERIRRGELEPAAAATPAATGERRQLTVLDCGLACDSGCAADCADPGALAARLAAPLALACRIVEAGGGHLDRRRPGGLTALFGWPQADERAARHAAASALALRRELANRHPEIVLTIGIDSGDMLDGDDASGGWQVAEQAMRLRLTAPPGGSVVGATLAASLRGHFELPALPAAAGRPRAFRLAAEAPAAPASGERWPLFGREAPLAALAAAWRAARGGALRVIAVSGEAGIGKSRLLREFARANRLAPAAGAPLTWCECDPQGSGSPLLPILHALRRTLALPAAADAARRRLAAALAAAGGRADAAALLLPLFCPEQPGAAAERKHELLGALGDLLAPPARPAVLVLEDLHWADASTLDLLDALARRPAGAGLLLVLTARRLPALPAALAQRIESVALAPLDAASAARLATACGVGGAPAAEALQSAEGVPLFIVELARMQAAAPGAGTLPSGLRDLLAARLRQAGADQPLLQAAAVIGREFSLAELRRLATPDACPPQPQPLAEAVRRLTAGGLLEAAAGHDRLRFSHALLQRAAYESLPGAQRAASHRRHAALLQSQEAGPAAPAAVAWHLEAGGLAGEAADWWLRAARQAGRLAAYAETAQSAERALAGLASLPAEARAARHDTELGALLLAAYARVALHGYFDDGAQALYARARLLAAEGGADPRQTLGVLRGHWIGASSRASYREARAIAGEMTALADAAGLDFFRGVGRYLGGNAALWLGEFEAARALLEEAVAILARAPFDTGALCAHEQDFEATAIGYLGWAHWYLGRADHALALGRRAQELAQRRGHLLTQLHTALTFCSIAMGSEAADEVRATAERMIALAQPRALAMWADVGLLLRHWAAARPGGADDADDADDAARTADAEQALERLARAYPGGGAGFQAIFAEACLARGDCRRARRALAALDRVLQATEAHAFAAIRHLLAAELAQRQQRRADAAADFRRAVETAAAQGAVMLESRGRAGLRALAVDADQGRLTPD